jgi:GntR family transcriptional regulator
MLRSDAGMPLDLQIATGGNVPIYRQIVDQIRCAVAAGQLAVGDKLPSVRAVAERLVVNPNTVAKAYNDLVRDGVVESRHGLGVFVAKRRAIFTRAERLRRLDAALDAFLSEVLVLDFNAEEIQDAVQKRLETANGRGGKE